MKILVVDDDEVSRLTLASILREQEVEIVQADSGESAWQLLAGGLRPVACCVDVMMPNVDGLELLRRTRSHRYLSDLPVVLISSAAERETVQTAMTYGIAGFLVKPFRAQVARTCVQRAYREFRELRSEPLAATRRRLHLGRPQVQQMLAVLRSDAENLAHALSAGLASAEQDTALRRLYSGCLVLGLWKCAAALKEPADPAEAVREVQYLIDEQLSEAREPAAA